MKVVFAPDSFGGTLSAHDAAAAMVEGWRRTRPQDEVAVRPLSDGGEGLLDVVARPDDTWVVTEVAGPQGHPVDAAWLWRADGTAVIESARACGLHMLPPERLDPRLATTYGVGQLLDAAQGWGARRIFLGLGGSATVDGGAGALTGLGFRPTVADGSGLKIGADDLHRVAAISRGWAGDWGRTEVTLLADVDATLAQAAARFGPQKGATDADIPRLDAALAHWAGIASRDLPGEVARDAPGTGAAGGLGFRLAAALPHTRLVAGASEVARMIGLHDAVAGADLVVTGEGRLDATSDQGKVAGFVRRTAGTRVAAVVGAIGDVATTAGYAAVVAASPDGPGDDPSHDVAEAAARLAADLAS